MPSLFSVLEGIRFLDFDLVIFRTYAIPIVKGHEPKLYGALWVLLVFSLYLLL